MHRKFFGGIGILIACGLLVANAALAAKPDQAKGQILVKFKSGADAAGLDKLKNNFGASKSGDIAGLGTYIVDVPEAKKAEILKQLANNPNVEYAEPDYIATVFTNDTYFANQWGLNNTGQTINKAVGTIDADIDAPEAWSAAGTNSVLVAVLDTGVDQNHVDLAGKITLNKNFTTSRTVDDNYGHGTHVAGIIAAKTGNGTGVAGVCPNCKIMNVKVLDDKGSGQYSWIANGIKYAADNGAKVINMSLGGTAGSQTLADAIAYAANKGVVIVAAAGNNGRNALNYPAAYAQCIAVASTNNKDIKSTFSNYGSTWVDIAAPGEYIYSTTPNHTSTLNRSGYPKNYAYLSGTSMASPMVAGVAGLVFGSLGNNTEDEVVRAQIESNTDAIAGTGSYWQYGRVNAAKSLGMSEI